MSLLEGARVGVRPWEPISQVGLQAIDAFEADRRGRWQEAAVRYEVAIEAVARAGAPPIGSVQLHARAARLHVHRDQLVLAVRRLTTARETIGRWRADSRGPAEFADLHLAEANVALACGDAGGAQAALQSLTSLVEACDIDMQLQLLLLPHMLAVATAVDDHDQIRHAVQYAQPSVATADDQELLPGRILRWCRARLDLDDAPFDELVRWVEHAPIWEWKPLLLEDAARVFVAAGRHGDAVHELRKALALWDGVVARRDVARVRQALRALGEPSAGGTAPGRPSTGWASLTDAEWRVLELIEEGLVYREIGERLFISRRTVETHVSHIFDKLGVSSRRDLTRRLPREGCGDVVSALPRGGGAVPHARDRRVPGAPRSTAGCWKCVGATDVGSDSPRHREL